jgi:hypothetical protein
MERIEEHPDVISILLSQVAPGKEVHLSLTYSVKIPSDKFTKYGFDNNGTLTMKNWFLPARFENHHFVVHSNENPDDIANAPTDYQIEMKVDIRVYSYNRFKSTCKSERHSFFL